MTSADADGINCAALGEKIARIEDAVYDLHQDLVWITPRGENLDPAIQPDGESGFYAMQNRSHLLIYISQRLVAGIAGEIEKVRPGAVRPPTMPEIESPTSSPLPMAEKMIPQIIIHNQDMHYDSVLHEMNDLNTCGTNVLPWWIPSDNNRFPHLPTVESVPLSKNLYTAKQAPIYSNQANQFAPTDSSVSSIDSQISPSSFSCTSGSSASSNSPQIFRHGDTVMDTDGVPTKVSDTHGHLQEEPLPPSASPESSPRKKRTSMRHKVSHSLSGFKIYNTIAESTETKNDTTDTGTAHDIQSGKIVPDTFVEVHPPLVHQQLSSVKTIENINVICQSSGAAAKDTCIEILSRAKQITALDQNRIPLLLQSLRDISAVMGDVLCDEMVEISQMLVSALRENTDTLLQSKLRLTVEAYPIVAWELTAMFNDKKQSMFVIFGSSSKKELAPLFLSLRNGVKKLNMIRWRATASVPRQDEVDFVSVDLSLLYIVILLGSKSLTPANVLLCRLKDHIEKNSVQEIRYLLLRAILVGMRSLRYIPLAKELGRQALAIAHVSVGESGAAVFDAVLLLQVLSSQRLPDPEEALWSQLLPRTAQHTLLEPMMESFSSLHGNSRGSTRAQTQTHFECIPIKNKKSYNSAAALSPDGRLFALGSKQLEIWTVDPGRQPVRVQELVPRHDVDNMLFSPDGQHFAVIFDDRILYVFDVATWGCRMTHSRVRAIQFSADGRFYVLRTDECILSNLQIWDGKTHQMRRLLSCHPSDSDASNSDAHSYTHIPCQDFRLSTDSTRLIAIYAERPAIFSMPDGVLLWSDVPRNPAARFNHPVNDKPRLQYGADTLAWLYQWDGSLRILEVLTERICTVHVGADMANAAASAYAPDFSRAAFWHTECASASATSACCCRVVVWNLLTTPPRREHDIDLGVFGLTPSSHRAPAAAAAATPSTTTLGSAAGGIALAFVGDAGRYLQLSTASTVLFMDMCTASAVARFEAPPPVSRAGVGVGMVAESTTGRAGGGARFLQVRSEDGCTVVMAHYKRGRGEGRDKEREREREKVGGWWVYRVGVGAKGGAEVV